MRGAKPTHELCADPHNVTANQMVGLPVPDQLLDALADRVAARLIAALPTPPDPYLDVDGAAEYLGRPKSRVYELVAQKRVRHHRDGRALLFRREDLDACVTVVEREAA